VNTATATVIRRSMGRVSTAAPREVKGASKPAGWVAGRRSIGQNAAMRSQIGVMWIGCVALLACGGSRGAERAAIHRDPTPLPRVEARLLDGGEWNAEQARGKVLVIDVWASWCKPCRKGFPILNELARRRPDVAFVAISIDEEEEAVRSFLQQVPVDFPVAIDTTGALTEPPLGVARIPTVLVVDADGVVQLRLQEPTEADYAEVDRVIGAGGTGQ